MNELKSLTKEVEELRKGNASAATPKSLEESVSVLMEHMIEERERTNRKLEDIYQRISKLNSVIESLYQANEEPKTAYIEEDERKEVALSGLDLAVLDFIQSRGMACADDLMQFMGYKGRNAACARLNRLNMKGLLQRHQLGHKVYYRYAGKTTNTLIISPPQ
ncbi:MAG: hypothetical protein QXF01_02935 [Candidatus Micrarchaeaceae archaeon]